MSDYGFYNGIDFYLFLFFSLLNFILFGGGRCCKNKRQIQRDRGKKGLEMHEVKDIRIN